MSAPASLTVTYATDPAGHSSPKAPSTVDLPQASAAPGLAVVQLPDLAAYAETYRLLREGSGGPHPSVDFAYQTPGWIESWLETLGKESETVPLFLSLRQGDRTVLLLPLGLRRSRGAMVAQFLGQPNANQNVGVWDRAFLSMADPQALSAEIARALRPALKAAGVDLLHLANTPEAFDGCPLALPGTTRLASMNPVFRAALDRDFDTLYRDAFSKSSRKTLQRKEKALQEAGAFRVFEAQTSEEVTAALEVFQTQRQARADLTGIPNAFGSEAGKAFLRRLTTQAATGVDGPEPKAQHSPLLSLWCLEAAGAVRATYLCAQHDRTLVGYTNSIAHDDLTARSPGVVLLKEMLSQVIGAGRYATLDLGLGDERYKHGWSTPQPLHDLFLPVTRRGQIALGALLMVSRTKTFIRSTPLLWALVRKARNWKARHAAPAA